MDLSKETNTPKIKDTIIQLLSNLANPKEIQQYLDRFTAAGQTHFAVIKVGGAVLDKDLDNLCSSLAFLDRIGLFPIVVHGAGPQLTEHLNAKNIESQFIDGQRVTSAPVLKTAKEIFVSQNLILANRLQNLGVKTSSITTGVFQAKPNDNTDLGYVGEVTDVTTAPIKLAIESGAIPILSPLAETDTGQTLNINADVATNQLAIALQPYKIIFLTETGGLLDKHDKVISSVNLATDFEALMAKDWLHSGMKLKIKQINDILKQLPNTASVSITKPLHLSKELFTHKGSGTLIRMGESIVAYKGIEGIDTDKIATLLESSFKKSLQDDYFDNLGECDIYITQCYRAAAIIRSYKGMPYLDKFVVGNDAKGEGLGKTLWQYVRDRHEQLFWRCMPHNTINGFYFTKADGCYKTKTWNFFWYGINDFTVIDQCFKYALEQPLTLKESQ